jgi:hypothetical protein
LLPKVVFDVFVVGFANATETAALVSTAPIEEAFQPGGGIRRFR